MTARTKWPMVVPAGTKTVGTARVRDESPLRAHRREPKTVGELMHEFTSGPRVLAEPKKSPKYRNTKCEHDGIKFDSKREAKRYRELVAMQARGEIAELERQVVFVLAAGVVIAGRKRPALRYVADFVYERHGVEGQIVEDAKGRITEGYRIKRHLMKAVHGLDIVEI